MYETSIEYGPYFMTVAIDGWAEPGYRPRINKVEVTSICGGTWDYTRCQFGDWETMIDEIGGIAVENEIETSDWLREHLEAHCGFR